MKRLLLSLFFSALGAAVGLQVFIWRSDWLIQKQGGFYISQGVPYAATGAATGAIVAEVLATATQRSARRREQQRLAEAIKNESFLQGMPIEQQAVILAALENLQKTSTTHH